MALALLALASLFGSAHAAGLTGGEDYAFTRRTSASTLVARDTPAFGQLVQDGLSFTLGSGESGKRFFSPVGSQFTAYKLPASWGLEAHVGQTLPVTVMTVEGNVTCASVGGLVADFLARDDVFDESFMSTVLFQSKSAFHVDAEVAGCLRSRWSSGLIIKSGDGTSSVANIGLAHVEGNHLPNGPYIASVSGSAVTLTEVFRIYRDESQAFTTGAIRTIDDGFVASTGNFPGMNTVSIPVPSRLYADVANPRPMEGVRVAVKDIYDMAGLRTGCGNQAYWLFYPEREVNSFPVQRLLDQGAVLIGKTKTSSFANGEHATSDWVSQLAPFNPRGDGWQDMSSSSAGAGAAIASYEWLDIALGSDTGGSVRGPAAVQGVIGLRPSHNAIPLTNVMPMAAVLDTAGYLARDGDLFARFGRAWYGEHFKSYSNWPKTVVAPASSWTFEANSAAAPMLNDFKNTLAKFLNASLTDQGHVELWNSTGAIDTEGAGATLPDFMSRVYADLICFWEWTNLGAPWFKEFAAANDGREPAIAPAPRVRWDYGRKNLTEADYTEAVRRKEVMKTFMEAEILGADAESCSSAILITPWSTGTTDYRNAYRAPAAVPIGYDYSYASVFTETPEVVIPLGQVAYESTVSHHTEYLPVTVGLMARTGCDYLILDLVKALQDAGIIKEYKVGPSMV